MSIIKRKIQSMKVAANELIYSEKVSEEDEKKLKEIHQKVCDYYDPLDFDERDKSNNLDSAIWNIAREYDMEDRIAAILDSWAVEENL